MIKLHSGSSFYTSFFIYVYTLFDDFLFMYII